MIIFYNKDTGKIEGTIDGRIHTEQHLQMWIGDMEITNRLVVNWIPTKFYGEHGELVSDQRLAVSADYEPDHPQKDLFVNFELGEANINDYMVTSEKLLALR